LLSPRWRMQGTCGSRDDSDRQSLLHRTRTGLAAARSQLRLAKPERSLRQRAPEMDWHWSSPNLSQLCGSHTGLLDDVRLHQLSACSRRSVAPLWTANWCNSTCSWPSATSRRACGTLLNSVTSLSCLNATAMTRGRQTGSYAYLKIRWSCTSGIATGCAKN
jgi:hypothetical protein